MGKVLVIGSLNMDYAIRVGHIPAPGETILSRGMELVCGGKGANQAFTCGQLGCEVGMMGSVGQDDSGEALIQNLANAGVDTAQIQKLKDEKTGLAVIAVEDSGNNSIMVVQGANLCSDADYIQANRAVIAGADAVVMQLEIPIEAVLEAAKEAKKQGKIFILDPAPAAELPESIYECIDIMKPNETELEQLTGIKIKSHQDVEKAAHILLDKGVKQVVVTLGGDGAMLVSKGKCRHYPAKDVKVVDTTAAGDSFTAAMAMLLVEGYGIEEAIPFAIEVSNIVVTRAGAQSSIPGREEVAELIPRKR